MPVSASIRENLYKDSVALMRIAQTLLARPGMRRATLLMGTPANKQILAAAGLDAAGLAPARPGDVMVVLDAETPDALVAASAEADRLLEGEEATRGAGAAVGAARPVRSIALARARGGEAALAQISVPGPYAAAEAMKALRQGLHVFLFSDNVALAQERAVKLLARDKGLLVMGPDCGTAILGGVPIGFANVVRKGSISLVGASGTGLQEVACRIHALGYGVRHAIGTGGRDVYEEIGGITMCQSIDLLAQDAATRVIAIVSKPPAPEVARRVLQRAAASGKRVVVLFLGADLAGQRLPEHIVPVRTLEDAASAAVALAENRRVEAARSDEAQRAAAEAALLTPGQRYVRGLYSGGTFCTEAQLVWRERAMRVYSNAPLEPAVALEASAQGREHAAIDLGADEFTVGRPHPMIDPTLRIERLAREARDPTVGVIVLDVVLGHGAHEDPAAALAPAIREAKAACAEAGRGLAVVTFLCGTEDDPQSLSAQREKLEAAGAIVQPGSTAAALFAAAIAERVAVRRAVAAVA